MVLFTIFHSFILVKFLPPLFDEAYYHSWSKYFSLGYFDHPPMVSWLERIFSSMHGFLPSFRIVSLIISLLLLLISSLTLKVCGILHWKTFVAVYALSQFSMAGIALKTIYTPDTPLILFWSCCLFGLLAARRYHLSWLLFAAVCFGLACISKYTAILLGPCILVSLFLVKDRKNFTVYLTGSILFFALTVSPHVYWLSKNQFISVTAQLSHGLSGKVKSSLQEKGFPKIKTTSNKMLAVRDALSHLEQPDFKPHKRKSKTSKAPSRLGEVFGGFSILWGGFIFLILFQYIYPPNIIQTIDSQTRKVLLTSSLFPFAFFCITSLLAKVEANWLSITIPGLLPLVSHFLQHRTKAIVAISIFHIVLSFALLTHTQKPFLNLKKDRLLYETKGYKELVERKKIQQHPSFTHSYQMASMMNYYSKTSDFTPYLGYARFSQYDMKHKHLVFPNKFQFITHHTMTNKPKDYQLVDADIMLICKHVSPIILNVFNSQNPKSQCDYSHYFLRYEFKKY